MARDNVYSILRKGSHMIEKRFYVTSVSNKKYTRTLLNIDEETGKAERHIVNDKEFVFSGYYKGYVVITFESYPEGNYSIKNKNNVVFSGYMNFISNSNGYINWYDSENEIGLIYDTLTKYMSIYSDNDFLFD